MSARRVNGAGSAPFQRPGRKGWYSFVRVTDALTGESRRLLVSGATKTALATKVRETIANAEQGAPTGAGSRMTVEAYAERWATDHLPARDVTPSTRRLYRHALSSYVVPTIGGMRIDKVRATDVERIDGRLQELGLSTSTRRLAYNVVRSMFETAVRDKVMLANPATAVARPSDPPRTQAHYKPDEVRRLLAEVADERVLVDLVPLMLYTGLRVGEALALRWSSVDLDAGVVTIEATLAVDDGGRVYRQAFPKSKRARLVPLVEPARAALRSARKAIAEDRLAVGEAYLDNGLVFADPLGALVDDRTLRKAYRPAVARAGLTGSFHALRRSTATLLTGEGVPLGIVASILGHSSTAITQAHYTVVDVDMMRAGLATLDARMSAES